MTRVDRAVTLGRPSSAGPRPSLELVALHVFNAYFVAPLVEGKEDVYGVLGIAAGTAL
jgi:hypothetical protein